MESIEHTNSRFEIFSINATVANSQFDKGNVCGSVRVVDTCRLADGCWWVRLDVNDDCNVSFFRREWYHARDQTYLLCNGSHRVDLKKFCGCHLSARCGTIKFDREDRRILLDYVAVKDAVDTTMQLMFKPVRAVRISGSITASYGKDIHGDCGFLALFAALHKSAMAVPANGCLKMQANLVDVDTKQRIVDETKDISVSGSSDSVNIWKFKCDIGFFELTVLHGSSQASKRPGSLSRYNRALCPVLPILSGSGNLHGIILKLNILIPLASRNVLRMFPPNLLHIVSPSRGVYNPMSGLESRLVGILHFLQMLLDVGVDLCPVGGFHVRPEIKLGLQSYTTKQRQS
nr:arginine--tRNA ligase, chloroplastic/mitochondrial [Tanacetum cinerariifolium]